MQGQCKPGTEMDREEMKEREGGDREREERERKQSGCQGVGRGVDGEGGIRCTSEG